MSKTKSEVKIETPTLSRRAIVVENEAFKNELQNSADKLRDAIQRTRCNREGGQAMNPDNPNFRTPEEEARAAELVKLRAEVARQARVIEKLREQRDVLIVHAHDDSATKATIQAYRDNLDKAIEQEEGV